MYALDFSMSSTNIYNLLKHTCIFRRPAVVPVDGNGSQMTPYHVMASGSGMLHMACHHITVYGMLYEDITACFEARQPII